MRHRSRNAAKPLTSWFSRLTFGQRDIYIVTLALAAAAIPLIAPSAQHRILLRCGDKSHVVRVANRHAVAGLALVALAARGRCCAAASYTPAKVVHPGPHPERRGPELPQD